MSSRQDGAGEAFSALAWRRSRFCAQGECVEIAVREDRVLMRDSKTPYCQPLSYTKDEFSAFVRGVIAGDFDDIAGI